VFYAFNKEHLRLTLANRTPGDNSRAKGPELLGARKIS